MLSFIVPVYNVAPYLRKCVDSLLAQDYSDYEVILVDDGSTDGSGAICDEYASPIFINSLTRSVIIKVIHQANGGLSAARNAGLNVAKGDYVCFVDSDDYWEENMLGGLVKQIEQEKLDVLRFEYRNVNERYEIYEPNKHPHQVDTSSEVVYGEAYLNNRMGYECYAVVFIIRRRLLVDDSYIDGGCFFTEGIYFEDTEWTPRMILRAQRVNATQKIVYNYLTRTGSITKSYDKEHIKKKIESLMKVNISLQSLLSKVKDGSWIRGCMADNTYCILNNAAAYDYKSVSYWIREIKKNNMLPLCGYKVRKMTMLRYGMINFSPRLYCWLRHIRMHYLKR